MNKNKKIGKILIGEKIGRGGFGEIYSGIDTSLNRKVAIKLIDSNLSNDKQILSLIKKGAITQGQINHPNIVSIYSFDKVGPVYYIIFEFVEGNSLKFVLDTEIRIKLDPCIEYIKQILRGLHYAHLRNIVHFDIKPSNIMITNSNIIKITDFGISQLFGMASKKEDEQWYGTPTYASPEQILGLSSDFRSDIYSLGITIYQMLTGRFPFNFDLDSIVTKEILLKENKINIPDDIDKRTKNFIDIFLMKAIKKDVEMRYQNILEMLEILDNINESL